MKGQCLVEKLRWVKLPAVLVACLFGSALLVSCTDIRDYDGTWHGTIVKNQYLRLGFDSSSEVTLQVTAIDSGSLEGYFTLLPGSDSTSGFQDATLIPVEQASNDSIGDLQFDGDPIATYLFFAAPVDTSEASAMVIISAHAGDKMEMRLLRYDLYGVFRLTR